MLAKNLHILWVTPASFRGIGSRKEIRSPDDMKGMKIRSTASSIDRSALQAFGANPVAMGFGEVYTGLQQGTIDGEGLPPDLMFDMKHHEVVRYVVMNNYNTYLIICAMNAKFYDGLPKDLQAVVDDAALEAVKYANQQWTPMLNDRVKKMEAAGVKIYFPNAQEMKVWKDKVQPVVDKFTPEIGTDFVRLVRETLQN
jgi:TRAP-type C4-dicarboxylate transport system substrate-binding protein